MPNKTGPNPADPLEAQEITILNEMLAALHPKAKAGDELAIDRIIKIIALKRQLRDGVKKEESW